MEKIHIVYIIGFMGSGKTTAGKKLASLLGWSFIDLDEEIVKETGKSIPDIFSGEGEEHFRNIESKVLKNLNPVNNTVISTGGGASCHNDNMEFMLNSGLTVYLKMTPSQLVSRLESSSDKRPLIKNMDKDSMLEYIEEKLIHREKWYGRAEISVDGFDLNIRALSGNHKVND